MATTTATISISSMDLIPSTRIQINASTQLMKAGLTTGLDMVEMGKGVLTVAGSNGGVVLKEATAAGATGSSKVYLCNDATDDTYYIQVKLHDTVLGRLYAGDWMFIPWGQTSTTEGPVYVDELSIEAEGGTCPYKWAVFKEGETLVARTA